MGRFSHVGLKHGGKENGRKNKFKTIGG